MKKADFEDTWESNFLLGCISILFEFMVFLK
jgi:hypothetical protein